MSTVTVKQKDGRKRHYIYCRYEARGDKFVIIHDKPDIKNGGLMPSIQKVFDKSELESIKQED